MAYVPGCSADGFISCAHADNADKFVTKLKNFRQGSSWARADIWFDDRISVGEYFEDEIAPGSRTLPS